jgi:acylphosphatase
MSTADTRTLALRVHGRVQGVWFRGWTVEQASALGLAGWVRNRADGTVEILARGPAAAVEDLARRCHDGPPAARVTRVDRAPSSEVPGAGFHQRPTV